MESAIDSAVSKVGLETFEAEAREAIAAFVSGNVFISVPAEYGKQFGYLPGFSPFLNSAAIFIWPGHPPFIPACAELRKVYTRNILELYPRIILFHEV